MGMRLRHGCTTLLLLAFAASASAEMGVHWSPVVSNPFHVWSSPALRQVVAHNNQLFAVIEWGGSPLPLYKSSDGVTWLDYRAPFPNFDPPFSMAHQDTLISFKGKLWAMRLSRDVDHPTSASAPAWSVDGRSWTRDTVAPPWRNSVGTPIVVGSQLWALDVDGNKTYSSVDGLHWTLLSSTMPPGAPAQRQYVFFGSKLWMIGNTLDNNDVWWTADGKTWTRTVSPSPWTPRTNFAVAACGGKLWLLGGTMQDTTTFYNHYLDVWSTENGRHWERVGSTLPLTGSDYRDFWNVTPGALEFQNKLWLYADVRVTYWAHYTHFYNSWLAPGITTVDHIADQSIVEGLQYSGPRPALAQGTLPVTWSLVSGPAGMTIDSKTGIVRWPLPLAQSSPYRVTIKAAGSGSTAQASWSLTVTPQPAPVATMPPFSAGSQASVSWSRVPNVSGYTVERYNTPDLKARVASATVGKDTLSASFGGLRDGSTSWYRVRGITPGGVTVLWSNVTSCTQDAQAPRVSWVAPDYRQLEYRLAGVVRLFVSASDTGPAGLAKIRVSTDRKAWTPWQPFKSNASFWVGRSGSTWTYVQVCDGAGNLSDGLAATSFWNTPWAVTYVDGANQRGPWDGTLAHPHRKVQDALNASKAGDTIIVAPGVYPERLTFPGWDVVLRSADPSSREIVMATVLDGERKHRVVIFSGKESAACKLAGFTINNGKAGVGSVLDPNESGGGIVGNGSNAEIANNLFVGNEASGFQMYGDHPNYEWRGQYGFGGAISDCGGTIRNNIFVNNWLCRIPNSTLAFQAQQGAVQNAATVGKLRQNYYARSNWLRGSALCWCDGKIVNNTFWNNIGSGAVEYCTGVSRNNIFNDSGFQNGASSSGSVVDNNFLGDPKLVDPEHGDYSLRADSPCIDAGVADGGLRDIDGDARGSFAGPAGRGDGSGYDIGADEYAPTDPGLWLLTPTGGERIVNKGAVPLRWRANPARAGSVVLATLLQGGKAIQNLGEFSSATGDGAANLALTAKAGADYRIRLTSKSNPSLVTQTPPFSIAQ